MMRDTNKGFMAVKVKKDTYDILKAMAIENKCTLAALIHEAVSKLKPDDAGNIYNKVSRIEQSLKDLHSDFEQLQGWLSDFDLLKCHQSEAAKIKQLEDKVKLLEKSFTPDGLNWIYTARTETIVDERKKIGEYIKNWSDEWDDISSWNVMRRFVSQLELGKFSPEGEK